MSQVDLNELRNRVISNQNSSVDLPSSNARKVFVDREGNICMDANSGRPLSQVPQKTFAASLSSDRQTVASKLPSNTCETTCNGVTGWVYQIMSQLGDSFTMFAYNDGSRYQVMVAFPEVAGRYGQHDAHLFHDGRICFSNDSGMPTLEQAFAKSVLWATGFSVFLRTGKFPFSNNN
jgi:hypothetical protein